jgi:hypothetical protein
MNNLTYNGNPVNLPSGIEMNWTKPVLIKIDAQGIVHIHDTKIDKAEENFISHLKSVSSIKPLRRINKYPPKESDIIDAIGWGANYVVSKFKTDVTQLYVRTHIIEAIRRSFNLRRWGCSVEDLGDNVYSITRRTLRTQKRRRI